MAFMAEVRLALREARENLNRGVGVPGERSTCASKISIGRSREGLGRRLGKRRLALENSRKSDTAHLLGTKCFISATMAVLLKDFNQKSCLMMIYRTATRRRRWK